MASMAMPFNLRGILVHSWIEPLRVLRRFWTEHPSPPATIGFGLPNGGGVFVFGIGGVTHAVAPSLAFITTSRQKDSVSQYPGKPMCGRDTWG